MVKKASCEEEQTADDRGHVCSREEGLNEGDVTEQAHAIKPNDQEDGQEKRVLKDTVSEHQGLNQCHKSHPNKVVHEPAEPVLRLSDAH